MVSLTASPAPEEELQGGSNFLTLHICQINSGSGCPVGATLKSATWALAGWLS